MEGMPIFDAAYHERMQRIHEIRSNFYDVLREVSDRKLSPSIFWKGEGTLELAREIVRDVVAPDLSKKYTTPEKVIDGIDTKLFLRAAYAAAGEQNTRPWGKLTRATMAFDRDPSAGEKLASAKTIDGPSFARHPATKAWTDLVRQQLKAELL